MKFINFIKQQYAMSLETCNNLGWPIWVTVLMWIVTIPLQLCGLVILGILNIILWFLKKA